MLPDLSQKLRYTTANPKPGSGPADPLSGQRLLPPPGKPITLPHEGDGTEDTRHCPKEQRACSPYGQQSDSYLVPTKSMRTYP